MLFLLTMSRQLPAQHMSFYNTLLRHLALLVLCRMPRYTTLSFGFYHREVSIGVQLPDLLMPIFFTPSSPWSFIYLLTFFFQIENVSERCMFQSSILE